MIKILLVFAAVSLIMGGGETFGKGLCVEIKISFVTKVAVQVVGLFDLCDVIIYHEIRKQLKKNLGPIYKSVRLLVPIVSKGLHFKNIISGTAAIIL